MTAGIEQKVQVKEALFPYLISCIVVFGSLGIWKITVNIMKQIEPPTSQSSSTTQTSGSKTSGGSTTHKSSSGETHGGSGGGF